MRIALAADHVGFSLKGSLVEALEEDSHAVLDLGTHSADPVDYPAMARAVATAVSKGFVELGILVCETGIGGTIAANKCAGIRAASGDDATAARHGRERLDTNVLCLSGADLDANGALAIAREWLNAKFSGDERDGRVIEKIRELEGTAQAPRTARPRHASAPDRAAAPPVVEAPRSPDISAVLKFVAGVRDDDCKLVARRLLEFVRNRFPEASGVPTDNGFVFTLEGRHVVTATVGKTFVELQVGPDRIPTSRIRDVEGLELALSLPSIAKGFDGTKA